MSQFLFSDETFNIENVLHMSIMLDYIEELSSYENFTIIDDYNEEVRLWNPCKFAWENAQREYAV